MSGCVDGVVVTVTMSLFPCLGIHLAYRVGTSVPGSCDVMGGGIGRLLIFKL